MLDAFDTVVLATGEVLSTLARTGLSTPGAILVLTLAVRLLLLPLDVVSGRATRARKALRPKELELQRQFSAQPGRLLRELSTLRKQNGVSLWAGFWPTLAQMPFFAVLFRLFASPTIGDHANVLFTHTLFGVPLGRRFLDGALLAPDVLVYLGLFAVLALVAWWSSSRQAKEAPELPSFVRVLPYASIVGAAFVPLAAALYIVTTTVFGTVVRHRLATVQS